MDTDIAGLVLALAIFAVVMTAAKIGIRLQDRKRVDDKETTDESGQDD